MFCRDVRAYCQARDCAQEENQGQHHTILPPIIVIVIIIIIIIITVVIMQAGFFPPLFPVNLFSERRRGTKILCKTADCAQGERNHYHAVCHHLYHLYRHNHVIIIVMEEEAKSCTRQLIMLKVKGTIIIALIQLFVLSL